MLMSNRGDHHQASWNFSASSVGCLSPAGRGSGMPESRKKILKHERGLLDGVVFRV